MFIEDIIKANLTTIFPGYRVDSSYCIKISRDADILIDDAVSSNEIIEQLKTKVKNERLVLCAASSTTVPCQPISWNSW